MQNKMAATSNKNASLTYKKRSVLDNMEHDLMNCDSSLSIASVVTAFRMIIRNMLTHPLQEHVSISYVNVSWRLLLEQNILWEDFIAVTRQTFQWPYE